MSSIHARFVVQFFELLARWDGPAIANANACEHKGVACSSEGVRVVNHLQSAKDDLDARFVKDAGLPRRDAPAVGREDRQQLDANDVDEVVGPKDGENGLGTKGFNRFPIKLLVVLSKHTCGPGWLLLLVQTLLWHDLTAELKELIETRVHRLHSPFVGAPLSLVLVNREVVRALPGGGEVCHKRAILFEGNGVVGFGKGVVSARAWGWPLRRGTSDEEHEQHVVCVWFILTIQIVSARSLFYELKLLYAHCCKPHARKALTPAWQGCVYSPPSHYNGRCDLGPFLHAVWKYGRGIHHAAMLPALKETVRIAKTLDEGGVHLCTSWMHQGHTIRFSDGVVAMLPAKYRRLAGGPNHLHGFTTPDRQIKFDVMAEAALQLLSGGKKLPLGVTKTELAGEEARFEHAGLALTACVENEHILCIKLANE